MKHIDGLCGEEEMLVSEVQERILKGNKKLKVFPVVRHAGKRQYYKKLKEAYCPRCGEPVRSDEDGLCSNCV